MSSHQCVHAITSACACDMCDMCNMCDMCDITSLYVYKPASDVMDDAMGGAAAGTYADSLGCADQRCKKYVHTS